MNQHRCETCKNCNKNPNDDYFCLVMNDEIDFTNFEHTAKVGCASHSDFQSERDTCPQNKIWQHCPVAEQIRKQERDKVLERLHIWFENYCEGNEDPDLWMAFLHAERTLRRAGEP